MILLRCAPTCWCTGFAVDCHESDTSTEDEASLPTVQITSSRQGIQDTCSSRGGTDVRYAHAVSASSKQLDRSIKT